MEDGPTWETWFPLNKYVHSQPHTFWKVFGCYFGVPLIVAIVMFIAGRSVPIVALIIGIFEMPILFYSIVGIILAAVTHRKAVARAERRKRALELRMQRRNETASGSSQEQPSDRNGASD